MLNLKHKKLIALAAIFATFWSFVYVSAAPYYTYQPTLLPQVNLGYDLGTSTQAWRTVYVQQVCITGDSCRTTWPSGGGGSSFSYPFPSNATSTNIDFSGGIIAASSTFTGLAHFNAGFAGVPFIATTSLTISTSYLSYTYNGFATTTIFTLPLVASSTGSEIMIFNVSTSTISINATTTDKLFVYGTTTSSVTVANDTPITLYDDSLYWEVK